ncbi:MAG: DNA-processing protein DprA [Clostridia bacterium]|nr:DNA-processing protein DprA [Clostridia bacterium]
MSDELALWVWLSLALGPASTVPSRLLHEFGSIKAVYGASEEEYDSVCKISKKSIIRLCDKNLENAQAVVAWCEEHKVGILTPVDIRYPDRLRVIKAAPIVLYYIGTIPDFDGKLCISSVGTRNISEYGRINAYKISYEFAKSGAVIVSGLAAGIDSVCHRGALDALGKTVAVLGCGIDHVYPKFNRALMKEIARKGLLISEYPPGTKPIGKNFPLRNRIISGLCQATVVYEADRASGSLITARYAREEGRKLYALPGMVGELNSLGTNDLIRSGAKMIVSADDLLSDYEEYLERKPSEKIKSPNNIKNKEKTYLSEIKPAPVRKSNKKPAEKKEEIGSDPEGLTEIELSVYKMLKRAKPKSFDELSESGYGASELLTALTMLEIKGLIISLPGGAYSRS